MIYELCVYARTGHNLFSHNFLPSPSTAYDSEDSERQKLVFGLLFSLKELATSLAPEGVRCPVEVVRTDAADVHVFETATGLRFVAFTSPSTPSLLPVLKRMHAEVWVETVAKSPLWRGEGVEGTGFGEGIVKFVKSEGLSE